MSCSPGRRTSIPVKYVQDHAVIVVVDDDDGDDELPSSAGRGVV